MLNREKLESVLRSVGVLVCLTLSLTIALPVEAALFQDPNPRVVITAEVPVTTSTQTSDEANTEAGAEASNEASTGLYIVNSGDTLSEIARKYQVNLELLISKNQIKDPNMMSVGKILHLPAVGAGDKQATVYHVARGDTLWGIAKKYELEIETLLAYNDIRKPNTLQIGQSLVIPADDVLPAMAKGTQMLASRSRTHITLDWPTKGTITSKYGRRWGEFHYGLDIANDTGTPIRAVAGGVVIAAEWRGSYGQLVVIEHDDMYRTLYAHNDSIEVEAGDWVARGQEIAKMGSTGRSTGPHLHFEVHQNGKALDPLRFLQR